MNKLRLWLLLISLVCWSNLSGLPNDSLVRRIESSSGIQKIRAMTLLADEYMKEDAVPKAETTYREALAYIKSLKSSSKEISQEEINIMLTLAELLLLQKAEYNQSLQWLMTVLSLAKAHNDGTSQAHALTLLGFNYRFLRQYEKAIEFLDEGIRIAEKIKDTTYLAAAMNEKANVYYFLHDKEKSRELHLLALEYAKQSKNSYAANYITHDLAVMYLDQQEFEKAVKYFLMDYKYCVDIKDQRQIAIVAINIAEMYLKLKKADSALQFINIADSITLRQRLMYERSLLYGTISEYYTYLNDYKNAYRYLLRYQDLSDTIFNMEKERQIAEMTAKYESDKKEQQLVNEQMKFRTTVTITLVSTGFIILIIILLLLNNHKRKLINKELEKRNETISNQKANLEMAFDILRIREHELKEANVAKNTFFSIIAHDLKNPFGSLLGFIELLKDHDPSISKEDQADIIRNISESADTLYKLLENLLEWARTQTNRIEIKSETIELCGLIRKNLELINPIAEKKEIELVFTQCKLINVLADQGMTDFVIRNLLSNALKYVYHGGKITVSVESLLDKVKVSIQDNGTGITKENLEKLFRIDSLVKTPGTEQERGTGLGLVICKEFIERNLGKIWVESTEGQGSKFFFTLPKSPVRASKNTS
jgi:signal transduction histidine kinase